MRRSVFILKNDKIIDRELFERLHGYFSKIGDPTDDEKSILTELTEARPDKRCEIIPAAEKALEKFGPSAVWVPVELSGGRAK